MRPTVEHVLKRFGLPRCAKCNRPVDSLENARDVFSDEMVFIARCHGAREVVQVPTEALAGAQGFAFGDAFTTAELPAPVPALSRVKP